MFLRLIIDAMFCEYFDCMPGRFNNFSAMRFYRLSYLVGGISVVGLTVYCVAAEHWSVLND